MTLPFLLEKEFKQIFRNPVLIGMMIFFTCLVLLVLPWAINFELKNASVSVVNRDESIYAERLIQKIDLSPTFEISGYHHTYAEAFEDIEQSRASLIIDIPDGFGENLEKGIPAETMLLVNAVDGSQASVAKGYMQGLIASFSDELLRERSGHNLSEILPVEIVPEYRFNTNLDSKTAMLPAFLAMLLAMFCGIFSAMSIVLERESGSLQQINVTPIKPIVYIFAKVLPFWILGLIVVGLGILLIDWVYGVPVEGSVSLLFLVSFAFIVAISLFGVIISNLSETLQQAMFLVLFFILILFLVSGLFTPVAAMPAWARLIAWINPLTYYIHATRLIFLRGSVFAEVSSDYLALLAFCLIFGLLALLSYHKRY